MIYLYHGSGVTDFQLSSPLLSEEDWQGLKGNVIGLLTTGKDYRAAELLRVIPFEIYKATNNFNDEFSVLYVKASLEEYVEIEKMNGKPCDKLAFAKIAATITEIGPYIRFVVADIDTNYGPDIVPAPSLDITSEVVKRVLVDAQRLLTTTGAVSAVDRIHTAMHGYLRAVCQKSQISFRQNANLTELFKYIIDQHPAFKENGPHNREITRVLRAIATIMDSVNSLRNQASVAHPSETLLEEEEAMLIINCARTILSYLDSKLHR